MAAPKAIRRAAGWRVRKLPHGHPNAGMWTAEYIEHKTGYIGDYTVSSKGRDFLTRAEAEAYRRAQETPA